ncbi:anti-sigma factor [Nocardioides flavescens]|uniref:Regulator of SigK n=1 Tax=Nocardioides flavescens TaxID=2691959 RepID=A0A6L7EV25_9ACTN|nr:anti-sigma factor [Nocardioides flavescens]MXG91233.1 anti-sigma factor [Nocardioides flavescens]
MIDIHALSGAYAVDALDDDERSEFERHLAECPACQAEVASLREAATLLAETTPVTPSAVLRDRVLADIATVRPLPPVVEQQHQPAIGTVTTLTSHRESRRRRRVVPFLAAAAAVIAIGTGGVVYQAVTDEPPTSSTEQVLEAGDAQRFTVDLDGGGTATVVRSRELNQAVIETHDMPDAPAGHAFVLWLGHDGVMTQAGVMPQGADQEVLMSGDAATATSAAVSLEDADTNPTSPSDDVVASFDLST